MSFESPASVLYDDNGIALAVSGGVAIPVGTTGIMMAGVGPNNTASFARFLSGGELLVSGNVNTTVTFPATQSVNVINITTSSLNGGLIVNQGLSSSFSNAWNVVLSDGTKRIGSGSDAPVFIKEADVNSSSISTVGYSATSTTIISTNVNRQSLFLYNYSNKTLFLSFGNNTATTTLFTTKMTSNTFWEVPKNYTGQINGIWDSNGSPGTGGVNITELFYV